MLRLPLSHVQHSLLGIGMICGFDHCNFTVFKSSGLRQDFYLIQCFTGSGFKDAAMSTKVKCYGQYL